MTHITQQPLAAAQLPRAISYARFSSGSQAKGSSIERQLLSFEKWLEGHRTTYTPLYLKDEGVSAYKGRNATKGSLSSFLLCIADGTIKAGDLLVVEAIDRLSRQSMLDSFDLVRDILKSGVSILTLESNCTYSKESLDGAAIYSLIAALQAAHDYSKRLGIRVGAAHESKRAKARAGERPERLVSAPWLKGGRLFEPFASLVSKAVELYLRGYGHRQIVIELQEDIRGNAVLLGRYGDKLNASTVRKWLKATELAGDWESKEGLIENCFEPLITRVQWNQLQQESARRTKTPSKKNDYELSGLVRCASCDATFHTRVQKPKPTKAAPAGSEAYSARPAILYCNCSNYLKNGACTNNATWSYDVLLFVYQYGLTEILADIHMSKDAGFDKELNAMEEQLAAKEVKKERCANLYSATGELKYLDLVKQINIDIDIIKLKKKEREALVAGTTAVLGGEEFTEGFTGSLVTDLNYLNRLPLLELRHLLKQFRYQVTVDGKLATLSTGDREEFTLIRRLQRYANAYLVKVELPEVDDPLENSWIKYFAVGAKGNILAQAGTEKELTEALAASAFS